MRTISNIGDLEEGVAELAKREARFAFAAQEGLPPLRRKAAGFTTLAEIVIEQMISLKAAQAITARLRAEFEPFDALNLAHAQLSRLRALGLSQAKAEALKTIAQAVAEARFDLTALTAMLDDDARSALMSLKGVGAWTADVYLLTALGRSDAWPAGDVALQVAMLSLFGLESRPDRKTMEKMAEPWRPWRSVAARLLWMHYRKVKTGELVKANSLAPFTALLHKI